jgi:hypothetical protein
MHFYYRTVQDGNQKWITASSSEYKEICKTSARHASIYFLNKEPDGDDDSKVGYTGDLWLDIDFNPEKGGDKREAIEKAIEDIRAIQKYLQSIGVNLNSCLLFISGGKGFHLRIYRGIYGGGLHKPFLPKIHREMVIHLISKTGMKGVDMSLYNMGKTKLLRVENHQRLDGNYKVPITWSEFDTITVDKYFELCSSPREIEPPEQPVLCDELVTLYNESVRTIGINLLNKRQPMNQEFLNSLESEIPKCIENLCANTNIRDVEGRFNQAKMSLVSYLGNAKHTDDERAKIIDDFCENFESDRCKTSRERKQAVKDSIRWGDKNAFECDHILKLMVDRPCNGCPIKVAKLEEAGLRCAIEESAGMYMQKRTRSSKNKDDEELMVSNFTLQAEKEFYDVDEHGNKEGISYVFKITYERKGLPNETVEVDASAFLNSAAFKKSLTDRVQAVWLGSDKDLSHLKNYLTSPEMLEGAQRVIPVKKEGVARVKDASRGIDEFVWVQNGWSINSNNVANTVTLKGIKCSGDDGAISRAADLKAINTNFFDARVFDTFRHLMYSRGREEIAVMLGWVSSCWLKPMLQTGLYTMQFPCLHLWGDAGAGKTQLARTFAFIAAGDYTTNEPVNIANMTAFTMENLVCSTSTVPIILDEVNKAKADDKKYRAAVETIKSTASKMGTQKGIVINNSLSVRTPSCTAPTIFMSTTKNDENEVIQRSVIIHFDKFEIYGKPDSPYVINYKEVNKNEQDLFVIAKMLMEKVISLTDEDINRLFAGSEDFARPVADQRMQKSMRCVHTGLSLLHETLSANNRTPQDILDYILELRDIGLVSHITNPANTHFFSDNFSETDRIMQRLLQMTTITSDMPNKEMLLLKDHHYVVDESYVHFKLGAVWSRYKAYCRDNDFMIEYASSTSFIQGVRAQEYYAGTGKAIGVSIPRDWSAFSLSKLQNKKIEVDYVAKSV